MSSHAEQTSFCIIPLPVLGTLLVSCMGFSWLMVPKRGELLERLFKDKQYERVVSVLRTQADDFSSMDVSQLRRINSEQFAAISHLLNLTPREQLQNVFASRRPPEYDLYIHHIVLAAVKYVDVMPAAEALRVIEPNLSRVPDVFRVPLLRLLAQNANGSSKPDVAAACLRLACESSTADWSVAQEMIQSFRWSGQGENAFRELDQWLRTHREQLSPAHKREAEELHYTLALETGQPGRAFDLCLQQMQAQGGAPPLNLLERSYSTALQSGRTKELVPWLEKFVEALPEAKLSLAQLYQTASGPGSTKMGGYRQWCQILAQWSDWNASFETAFSLHMRLAAMGEAASLTRCLALYVFLGRTEECCELLLVLRDTPEGQKRKRQLAQLLAELGRDDESKVCYEECLKEKPDDRNLLYEYGCLHEDMGDEPASRKVFELLVQRHPEDEFAIKKLAESCIRDADYTTALSLYHRLPDAAHNHDTLENYAMIAESLDNHEAEYRALRLTTKLTSTPSIELYLSMVEAAAHMQNATLATQVLEEGLQRLPQSSQLRIALAGNHIEAERYDEGVAYLLQDNLRGSFEVVQILLSLCEVLPDSKKVLAFLGDRVESRFPLTATNRLQLAVICFNAGRTAECDRLFASVPETPDTLPLLARNRFIIGDTSEALRLLSTYLNKNAGAGPEDWVLLGDIYGQMGRTEDAVKAYDQSLVLLTADLPAAVPN